MNVVFHLKSVIHSAQQQSTVIPNVSLEQLSTMAQRIQEIKEREQKLAQCEGEIGQRSDELEQKMALFEATKTAVNSVLANDYQLEQIKVTLQVGLKGRTIK